MSDEAARTEEEMRQLRYRCYLEAYTQARSGGVVKTLDVIEQVADTSVEDRETCEDISLARSVAIGASDGSHPCPQPMGQAYFEGFLRGEKGAAQRAGDSR